MRKRRGWKWKRVAACFLTAAMLLTMPGMSAFADEADALVTNTGGCEHHLEHTEDCGYTEGEAGTPCEHEHTEACYTLVKKCIDKCSRNTDKKQLPFCEFTALFGAECTVFRCQARPNGL